MRIRGWISVDEARNLTFDHLALPGLHSTFCEPAQPLRPVGWSSIGRHEALCPPKRCYLAGLHKRRVLPGCTTLKMVGKGIR